MAECSVHPGNLLPGCHWCRTGTEPGPVLPGKVFAAKAGTGAGGDGWTYIGEDGGLPFAAPIFDAEPEPVPWPEFPVTLSVTVDYSGRMTEFRRHVRTILWWWRLAKQQTHQQNHTGPWSRCKACHPEQDRRPLAVNGHEYRRRQLARVRRER